MGVEACCIEPTRKDPITGRETRHKGGNLCGDATARKAEFDLKLQYQTGTTCQLENISPHLPLWARKWMDACPASEPGYMTPAPISEPCRGTRGTLILPDGDTDSTLGGAEFCAAGTSPAPIDETDESNHGIHRGWHCSSHTTTVKDKYCCFVQGEQVCVPTFRDETDASADQCQCNSRD